ncbi:hypothetical protein SAMN05421688_2913 [Poseidonocella pacifica]|uniref:Copper(I)-binding protein n=1 Tax=Poseidonocella pacifica TaxID=871651 RepID=A0A1I0YDK6_9RHOB|nr:copper chaperone PCu(A)C [Poseidonocella pacifica]SFB10866.1 hypothetical protein SAMN05421688_2913 [Poseidonocella pacifica]
MFAKTLVTGFVLAISAPASAEILIHDAYARAAMPNAPTGAAFMVIENTGDTPDRLVSVGSDIAARAELHTHIDAGNGIMQMRQDPDGFEVPAGGKAILQRGGDHVMLMGLTAPLVQGETLTIRLEFEEAGERVIDVPIDLERRAGGHGAMKHDH